MTSLLQSLVQKAAFDNGWEIVENGRVFRSGRHPGAFPYLVCHRQTVFRH